MKKRLKVNGVIIFIAFLLLIAFPYSVLRHKRFGTYETIAQVFGIAFILLGQLFRVSARGFKTEHSFNSGHLVIGGPYTLVRNPMYLGILLIGLGMLLALFKLWVACPFLFIFFLRYILLMFKEEKKLLSAFPKEYPDYCNKVPRIFPSVSAILKRDISEYLPIKLIWIKKEIGPILTVLLATITIDLWLVIKSESLNAHLQELLWIFAIIVFFIYLAVYLKRRTDREKNVSGKSQTAF